jgi:hypothetical protein
MGKSRDQILAEEVITAPYDEKAATFKEAREAEANFRSRKGIIHVFGYKHLKSNKFYAYMIKCLRAAYRCE